MVCYILYSTVLFRAMALPNKVQLWIMPWENILPIELWTSHISIKIDNEIRRCVVIKGLQTLRATLLIAELSCSPSQPPWLSTAPGKWIAMTTMKNSWNKWVSDTTTLKTDSWCATADIQYEDLNIIHKMIIIQTFCLFYIYKMHFLN